VTTTIPGMRRVKHVEQNLAASDARRLTSGQLQQLRACRWDRTMDDRP
jgi:aryl-alcohol dehydrogenase-like predicted oxidoreductase